MTESQLWTPIEGDLTDILKKCPQPLMALAAGETPAILCGKLTIPTTVRSLYSDSMSVG